MDRTSADEHVVVGGKRLYRDEDLLLGSAGTLLAALDRNALQEEVMKVIEEAGLTPDPDDWTQLWQALGILFQAKLGFTPVEQGGGAGQGANKVHIGWGTTGNALRAQVDTTDLGRIWADHDAQFGFGSPGYVQFPGGLIEQWGNFVTPTGNLDTVNFPLAFPNACHCVVACEGAVGGWAPGPTPTHIGTQLNDRFGFKVSVAVPFAGSYIYGPGVTVAWRAVGS